MSSRRVSASSALRGVLAATVIAVASCLGGLALPQAYAFGPSSASLNCAVYLNGSNSVYSTTVWSDSFTLTQSPVSPAAGDTVSVTFAAAAGPVAPVTVFALTMSTQVRVRVTGATSTAVTLTDGPSDTYPVATTAPGVPLGAVVMTGTYVAAAAGEGQLALEQFSFNEALDSPLINAPDEDVYCSGGGVGVDHKSTPVVSSVIVAPYYAPPISASLWCRYYFNEEVPGFAYPSQYAPYSDTFQLSQTPASPRQGDTVLVTMTAVTGPRYGPLVAVPGIVSPVATFALTGATTQTVVLDDGPTDTYPASAVPALIAWGPYSVSGSYIASGTGAATLALKQLKFDAGRDSSSSSNQYVTGNVDVYCSDSGGDLDQKTSPVVSTTIARTFTIGPGAQVDSVLGQAPGVTGYARRGDVLLVSGDSWAALLPNSAFSASIGGVAAASALTTDASGLLSGSVTIPSGVPSGITSVLIQGGGSDFSSIPLTILGTPSLVLSRAGASAGTPIQVTGSNFDPSTPHYVYASKSNPYTNRSSAIPAFAGATCPSPVPTTNPLLSAAAPDNYLASVGPFIPADSNGSGPVGAVGDYAPGVRDCGNAQVVVSAPDGSITATITALASQTGVLVTETTSGSTYPENVIGTPVNGRVALTTFTLNQDSCVRQVGADLPTSCETKQDVTATVNPGALTQTVSDYDGTGTANTSTSIDLGSVTTSNVAQVLGGHLNPVTVTDARGGQATWSLTAAMPDLTDGSTGSISRANVSLSGVSCSADAAGSATGNIAGIGGSFGTTLTLCLKNGTADSSGQTTGGRYVIGADMALTVPQFQKAAAYSTTITITLT